MMPIEQHLHWLVWIAITILMVVAGIGILLLWLRSLQKTERKGLTWKGLKPLILPFSLTILFICAPLILVLGPKMSIAPVNIQVPQKVQDDFADSYKKEQQDLKPQTADELKQERKEAPIRTEQKDLKREADEPMADFRNQIFDRAKGENLK
jgi:hypothetical protein